MNASEALAAYEDGALTRSELVSILARLPEDPLEDTTLQKDVDILRVSLDSGRAFEIRSWC